MDQAGASTPKTRRRLAARRAFCVLWRASRCLATVRRSRGHPREPLSTETAGLPRRQKERRRPYGQRRPETSGPRLLPRPINTRPPPSGSDSASNVSRTSSIAAANEVTRVGLPKCLAQATRAVGPSLGDRPTRMRTIARQTIDTNGILTRTPMRRCQQALLIPHLGVSRT